MSRNAPPKRNFWGERCVTSKKRLRGRLLRRQIVSTMCNGIIKRSYLQSYLNYLFVHHRLSSHLHGSRSRGTCAKITVSVYERGRLGATAELSLGTQLYGRVIRNGRRQHLIFFYSSDNLLYIGLLSWVSSLTLIPITSRFIFNTYCIDRLVNRLSHDRQFVFDIDNVFVCVMLTKGSLFSHRHFAFDLDNDFECLVLVFIRRWCWFIGREN